jgi:hypothetical protein
MKTCLAKYNVSCALQQPHVIENQRKAMLANALNLTSKAEDKFYEELLTLYPEDDIIRQYWIDEKRWLIDFYVKSIDTFIQFDGVYWHGLDRPIEQIRESTSKIDQNIAAAYDRDREQDEWFRENGKRLTRIIN